MTYGQWKFSGGGSMIGKGCHPLAAALYLQTGGRESAFGKTDQTGNNHCPHTCDNPNAGLYQ